jgi:hypothetical protein
MPIRQDKNGRWRDERGRFAKAPVPAPAPVHSVAQDANGRWRDERGRFAKAPVPAPAPVHSVAQDANGRWRDERGRFAKAPVVDERLTAPLTATSPVSNSHWQRPTEAPCKECATKTKDLDDKDVLIAKLYDMLATKAERVAQLSLELAEKSKIIAKQSEKLDRISKVLLG